MPYAPGVQDVSGQIFGAGLNNLGEAIAARQTEEKNRARTFKALQELADVSGVLPKATSTPMSLEQLTGHLQGVAAKRQQATADLNQQFEQAKLTQLQQAMAERTSGNQAMQGFTGDLAAGSGGPAPAPEDFSPSVMGVPARPTPLAPPPVTGGGAPLADRIITALAKNPAAANSSGLPKLLEALDRAQSIKTNAASFVEPGKDVPLANIRLPDGSIMQGVGSYPGGPKQQFPMGIPGPTKQATAVVDEQGNILDQALPDNRGNLKPIKREAPVQIPPHFHAAMDSAAQDISSAVTNLELKGDALKTAAKDAGMDPQEYLAGQLRRKTRAQMTAKAIVDRYRATDFLNDDQVKAMYGELGVSAPPPPTTAPKNTRATKITPEAPAAAASTAPTAAAPPPATIVPKGSYYISAGGKKYVVDPALKSAWEKKGYTLQRQD